MGWLMSHSSCIVCVLYSDSCHRVVIHGRFELRPDFAELRGLLNEEMPHFYTTLNTPRYTQSEIEYDVSMLLRVRFSPMDIHKLTGLSPSYVSNMRSRLLLRVFGLDGSPADYDKRVLAID